MPKTFSEWAGLCGFAVLGLLFVRACSSSNPKLAPPHVPNFVGEVISADKEAYTRFKASLTWKDKYWDATPKVREYANAMHRIPTNGCPEDFREAYGRHVYAVHQLADTLAGASGINGAVRAWEGGRPGTAVFEANKKVLDTWEQVDRIARKYGVQVDFVKD
jgi:hypothetical protein